MRRREILTGAAALAIAAGLPRAADAQAFVGAKRAAILSSQRWRQTKVRLRNSINGFSSAMPGNSGITPTITLGTANAAKTLTGTQVNMTDSRFLYKSGSVQLAGAGFPDNNFYTWRSVTYNPSPLSFGGPSEVEFTITGSVFEFRTKGKGSGSDFRLKIDGLYDPNGLHHLMPSDGNLYYVKVDLGSAATRTITIEGQAGFFFGGVVQNTGETLSAPSALRPLRLVGLGDSFTEGTGATLWQSGFLYVLGAKLGINDIWAAGSGGTGWVQTNGSRVALPDRYQYDAVTQAADIVLIEMGLNDIADGNDALVASLSRQVVSGIRRSRPTSLIYVCSPPDSGAPAAPSANYTAIKNAMQAACAGVGGAYFVDLTGISYTKFDATHPDNAGYVTLGNAIYTQINGTV
jgi:lysophospholipase L1-like esterase